MHVYASYICKLEYVHIHVGKGTVVRYEHVTRHHFKYRILEKLFCQLLIARSHSHKQRRAQNCVVDFKVYSAQRACLLLVQNKWTENGILNNFSVFVWIVIWRIHLFCIHPCANQIRKLHVTWLHVFAHVFAQCSYIHSWPFLIFEGIISIYICIYRGAQRIFLDRHYVS